MQYNPSAAHMGKMAMRADGGGVTGARANGGRAARASGGRTLEYTKESNVMDEAKERKNGGGLKNLSMEGMKTKHRRLDRPGRKRGGGVGADQTPLTTAAKVTQASVHKADIDET